MNYMTPQEIVHELDKYIIGQNSAKKLYLLLEIVGEDSRLMNHYVVKLPKNILMIGPTGVGKTEIARRLAKLSDAPSSK